MPSEPGIRVVFEDNHLFVVEKSAGILAQPDSSGDPDLLSILREFRRERDKKPGNIYLGLIHRLDRNVSGLMVVAKTSKAAARLSEAFRERLVRKMYCALVEGVPAAESGALRNFVSKDSSRRRTIVEAEERDGAQLAELNYEVMRVSSVGQHRYALLAIELGSGRFHQIRAQLSACGLPIVGDKKYGSKTRMPGRSIGLIAACLAFTHPVSGVPIAFSLRLPEYWQSLILSSS